MYAAEFEEIMGKLWNESRMDMRCSTDFLMYAALALTGEAGEVAEKIKRVARGDYNERNWDDVRHDIALEMGDVMYCIVMLCCEMTLPLNDVLKMCIDKHLSRAARGTIKGEGDNR